MLCANKTGQTPPAQTLAQLGWTCALNSTSGASLIVRLQQPGNTGVECLSYDGMQCLSNNCPGSVMDAMPNGTIVPLSIGSCLPPLAPGGTADVCNTPSKLAQHSLCCSTAAAWVCSTAGTAWKLTPLLAHAPSARLPACSGGACNPHSLAGVPESTHAAGRLHNSQLRRPVRQQQRSAGSVLWSKLSTVAAGRLRCVTRRLCGCLGQEWMHHSLWLFGSEASPGK